MHYVVEMQAIQVDSRFTYAYTLSGHELLASGDLDKATAMYRQAIALDERHYNAWCVPAHAFTVTFIRMSIGAVDCRAGLVSGTCTHGRRRLVWRCTTSSARLRCIPRPLSF